MDGEITIKCRAPGTMEGFAESCTSVLHCYLVHLEVHFGMKVEMIDRTGLCLTSVVLII